MSHKDNKQAWNSWSKIKKTDVKILEPWPEQRGPLLPADHSQLPTARINKKSSSVCTILQQLHPKASHSKTHMRFSLKQPAQTTLPHLKTTIWYSLVVFFWLYSLFHGFIFPGPLTDKESHCRDSYLWAWVTASMDCTNVLTPSLVAKSFGILLLPFSAGYCCIPGIQQYLMRQGKQVSCILTGPGTYSEQVQNWFNTFVVQLDRRWQVYVMFHFTAGP